jgi:hypothetical protein
MVWGADGIDINGSGDALRRDESGECGKAPDESRPAASWGLISGMAVRLSV